MGAYGVDVLDPAVSTRRVHVLLQMLPPGARRGGQAWSTESLLCAQLVDQLAALTYVTLKANGAKGTQKPKPVPRPPEARPFRDADAGRKQAVDAPLDRRGEPGQEPRKAGSWAQAATALAKIPGVEVSGGA